MKYWIKCVRFVASIVGVFLSCALHGDFSGDYAPDKWQVNANGGDGQVDWDYAPEELDLYSGVTGSGKNAQYEAYVKAPKDGKFRFYYDFWGMTDSGYGFAVIVNGLERMKLINEDKGENYEIDVKARDIFGFRLTAPKGGDPDGDYSTVNITEFYGPGQEPVIPTISIQPQSTNCYVGQYVTFSVTTTPDDISLYYQWQFMGQDIPDETGDTLAILNVSKDSVGQYRVIITNMDGKGVISQDAMLSVLEIEKPIITANPEPITTRAEGDDVTFSISASGTATLVYQWYFNGKTIEGALSSSLTLASLHAENAGAYRVEVSNDGGTAISADAILLIGQLPKILDQPRSLVAKSGENVTLSIKADGSAPFSYQWLHGDEEIIGGNQATLTINNVQSANQGPYRVVISNDFGTVNSAPFLLYIQDQELQTRIHIGGPGVMDLEVLGPSMRSYMLEVSTNLIDWIPMATNDIGANTFTFQDRSPSECRFYRARADLLSLPSAPSGLKVFSSDEKTVGLNWEDHSNNENRFIVERSNDGFKYEPAGLTAMNQTAFLDSTVVPGIQYWYQVRAENSIGRSDFSNKVGSSEKIGPGAVNCYSAVSYESKLTLSCVWSSRRL